MKLTGEIQSLSALFPWNLNPQHPLDRTLGSPKSELNTILKRKISHVPAGNRTQISHFSSRILVTTQWRCLLRILLFWK